MKVRVFEEFKSISGETCLPGQGALTYFVRLAGCNLRCTWCDTEKAQALDSGKKEDWGKVVERVIESGTQHVLLTGGEPLLQLSSEHLIHLDHAIFDKDIQITIETNGAVPWDQILRVRGLSYVVDFKLPSSGALTKMMPADYFLENLSYSDFVKFVIMDYRDFQWVLSALAFWKDRRFTPILSLKAQTTALPTEVVNILWENGHYDAIVTSQIHKMLGLQ